MSDIRVGDTVRIRVVVRRRREWTPAKVCSVRQDALLVQMNGSFRYVATSEVRTEA